MKAFLMHRGEDFDLERPLPPNADALVQDLELVRVFDAMARGDPLLFEVAKRSILSSLSDPEAIYYRQQILADCIECPSIVQELFTVAVEAIQAERRVWRTFMDSPGTILQASVQVLELLVPFLKRLRAIAEEHRERVRSDGFVQLFALIVEELDDPYLEQLECRLTELKFRHGSLMSVELGRGNKGTHYVLRGQPKAGRKAWRDRLRRSNYGFRIPDRDENGFRALSDLRGRGIIAVAHALGQSTDSVQ